MATREKYVTESDKITQARKFLDHYGIDESRYTDDEVIEKINKINEAIATTVQVLSRGQALDMMDKALRGVPNGFVGEFKHNADTEIQMARSAGWEILFDDNVKRQSPHGGGDGRVILGDSILMIIPEDQYIAQQIVAQRRRAERRKRRSPKKQAKAETSAYECPVFEVGVSPRDEDSNDSPEE